ncbi:MAG TPA: CcmD family protein [Gemmatimonadaceae bacterium]|nr:CcmD family protein [Gemmatimonadaceae bacterium]
MAEANGFIVAAYIVTWVGLLGYAWRLHGTSRRARAEYDEASRGTSVPINGGNSGGGARERVE